MSAREFWQLLLKGHSDSFQLFMYEAMGLCPQGRGGELIDSAEWITNKNGKLTSLVSSFQGGN